MKSKTNMTSVNPNNLKNESVNTRILRQYNELKEQHPDARLLFRCGDFYESYMEDAKRVSEILGITLTKDDRNKEQPLLIAGFPYYNLDIYLPKLIRAGERICICDQLWDNKQEDIS